MGSWQLGRWLADWFERRFPAYGKFRRQIFLIAVALLFALVFAIVLWSTAN